MRFAVFANVSVYLSTESRDKMSSSHRMMKSMRALMPWVCKRIFSGVSMLMVSEILINRRNYLFVFCWGYSCVLKGFE